MVDFVIDGVPLLRAVEISVETVGVVKFAETNDRITAHIPKSIVEIKPKHGYVIAVINEHLVLALKSIRIQN